jgi:hypothetical protein
VSLCRFQIPRDSASEILGKSWRNWSTHERVQVAAEACTARSAPRCTAPPGRISQGTTKSKKTSHPYMVAVDPQISLQRACDCACRSLITLCSIHLFSHFLLCVKLPRLRKRSQPPRVAAPAVLHVYREEAHTNTQHTQDRCAWQCRYRCPRP